jgi:hypothetical protein
MFPEAYTAGAGVYVQGGYGWLECIVAPVQVRFLRWIPTAGYHGRAMWRANEIFVFEDAGGESPDWEADALRIADRLREMGVRFTVCDRWLSARLRQVLAPRPDGAPVAWPRHNHHLQIAGSGWSEPARKFRPAADRALTVARGLADEMEIVLQEAYGPGTGTHRKDFDSYTLFTFEREPAAADADLWWNGFAVLH